jgi:hypothetical protein
MLRTVFTVNAISSGVTGAALFAAAAPLAPVFGLPGPAPLLVFAAALAGFALYVWGARREPLDLAKARAILWLDAAYVALSFALILLWPAALSPIGRLATALVADFVAVIAVFEYVGLRRARREAGATA